MAIRALTEEEIDVVAGGGEIPSTGAPAPGDIDQPGRKGDIETPG